MNLKIRFFKIVKLFALTGIVLLVSFGAILGQIGLALNLTENMKISNATEFVLLIPMTILSVFVAVKIGKWVGHCIGFQFINSSTLNN
jgi:ABC-type sugar transport system permease subunit